MVDIHRIRAEKEEWKTTLEINMLVKMINVMTERKIIGLIHIGCSWSFIFWIFWQNFPCFPVSAFTVSLSYENILSQNSQSTRRSLYRRGLNSAWSWNFSPNLINGWVLINKGSENSSLNKQVFCLYTLKSCLWKLQVILHNQVYFSSSIILTYTGYTTVMSFNN